MDKKYKYTVVRSWMRPHGYDDLDRLLQIGWEFVRASEFIPDNDSSYGYIEYILRREEM